MHLSLQCKAYIPRNRIKTVYNFDDRLLRNVIKITIPFSGTPRIVAIEAVQTGILSTVWTIWESGVMSNSSKLNEANWSSGKLLNK